MPNALAQCLGLSNFPSLIMGKKLSPPHQVVLVLSSKNVTSSSSRLWKDRTRICACILYRILYNIAALRLTGPNNGGGWYDSLEKQEAPIHTTIDGEKVDKIIDKIKKINNITGYITAMCTIVQLCIVYRLQCCRVGALDFFNWYLKIGAEADPKMLGFVIPIE